MIGILNSETTSLQSYKRPYTDATCPKTQDNFSDLVPSFVTVVRLLNAGLPSLNLINPMTANNLSHNAVMNSPVEYFSDQTGFNNPGTGFSCTSTVAFFKSINTFKKYYNHYFNND